MKFLCLRKYHIVIYANNACETQNEMIKKFLRDSVSGLQKAANTLGLYMKSITRYFLSGKGICYVLKLL